MTSNDDYVVYGGEFPRVNGVSQQGLVRFPAREVSPNNDQVQSYAETTPTLTPTSVRAPCVSAGRPRGTATTSA